VANLSPDRRRGKCVECGEVFALGAQTISAVAGTNSDLAAAAMDSQNRTTPTSRDVVTDKLSGGERRLIVGGVIVGLIVISMVVYFVIGRTWWEDHNRESLLALKQNAETLVGQGKLGDAKSQYDQMFTLVGNHPISSDELQASIKTAHDDADKVATMMAAQEQARRDEDRRQQEAKAEKDRQSQAQAAAEQTKVQRDAADAEAAAAQQRAAEQQAANEQAKA